MHISSDSWGWRERAILIAIIVIGVIVLALLASTDKAGAAQLAGNRGGCAPGNRWYGLACTVDNAGVGWVYGSCRFGLFFMAQTARTFRLGQSVSVTGCEGPNEVLYSAPGFPLRITR